MNRPVYITRLARFLPGDPVGNDEMEQYLGFVGGNFRSKSKPIILRNNKITTRYYALDKNGQTTYSNAQMTAEAVRGLFSNDFPVSKMELLACGTTTADQFLPSHASMVHGELKSPPVEAIGFSGSCCSGVNAMKYAWISVMSGLFRCAVTTGSERMSHWMRANNFREEAEKLKKLEENPILGFEKDFLRWMLSDGAAAALLTDQPNSGSLSLRIEYIDIVSFANQVETCMYAGAEKNSDGSLRGWADFDQEEWLRKSVFSLKQDTRLLDEHIIQLGTATIADSFHKHKVTPGDIDWFLPHISSEYFRSKLDNQMRLHGIEIPQEKWFLNLTRVGNVGAASILLALEELLHSGKLQKGQQIAFIVPESARFTYANALLTVC
jgi:3-oxoacyl-[acyl-carrier-protein] synthase-3